MPPRSPSADVQRLLAAEEAVAGAAALLVRGRAHVGGLFAKGDRDYATEVDLRIERHVRAALRAATPDIPFLGEETGGATHIGTFWALDPIDGTVNFTKGSPLCGISLALVERGRARLGLIDLPLLGERYVAREGDGAYLNGTRLHVAAPAGLHDAMVGLADFSVGAGAAPENRVHLELIRRLAVRCLRIRVHGSAALDLAWLAAGRLNATAMLSNLPWDVGAGVVIAREAGAVVFDADGRDHSTRSRYTLAAPPALRDALLATVAEAVAGVSPRIAILAPSPELTITIESAGGGPQVHLHAGGQGVWVARMAAALGAEVVLCCSLGGEAGDVLASLLGELAVEVRALRRAGWSGAYVHDRRGGRRRELVRTRPGALGRHEVDDLFGVALTAGLEADVTLLTGCEPPGLVPGHIFRRLAQDVRRNGGRVAADLRGPQLRAALQGGLDLLKLSSEELAADGRIAGDDARQCVAAMSALRDQGADAVVVSRASEPTLLLRPSGLWELRGPRFEALDPRGAGDSMFAAIGYGLAAGRDVRDAARLGVAAGALNVTRHGLGTGGEAEVVRLVERVEVVQRPLGDADPASA